MLLLNKSVSSIYRPSYLDKREVSISARAYVVVHIVPVVGLELLGAERDPRDLVGVVVGRVEAVAVVDVERRVRVSAKGMDNKLFNIKCH